MDNNFCNHYSAFLHDVAQEEQTPALLQQKNKCVDTIGVMKDPKRWAEVHSISYTAHRLKVNFLFLDSTKENEPPYCGVSRLVHGTYKYVVPIYWMDNRHFENICRIYPSRDRSKKATRKYVFHADTRDPFIGSLINQYQSECTSALIDVM